MGQYWKPVNVTKREYLHPHDLKCGLKLMEWQDEDTPVMQRIAVLLGTGQWSPTDDIRAIGDEGGEEQWYGERGDAVEYESIQEMKNVSKEAPDTH